MDYPAYRERSEQVKADKNLAFLASRARERKLRSISSASCHNEDRRREPSAAVEDQTSQQHDTGRGNAGAADGPQSDQLDTGSLPAPRRKSGLHAVTAVPSSFSTNASDVSIGSGQSTGLAAAAASSGTRARISATSASSADRSAQSQSSLVATPRRVSFANIAPSEIDEVLLSRRFSADSHGRSHSAHSDMPTDGSEPSLPVRSILRRSVDAGVPVHTTSHVTRQEHPVVHSESVEDEVFDNSTTSAVQKRQNFRLTRQGSAEVRYGVPPKPYVSTPIVVEERRMPAPTLRQLSQGKRRRSRVSDQPATKSAWQVSIGCVESLCLFSLILSGLTAKTWCAPIYLVYYICSMLGVGLIPQYVFSYFCARLWR